MIRGWLPLLVIALAVATVVLSIGWRHRRWMSQLGIGVPVTALLLGVAFGLVTWLSLLPRDYPKSLLAWIALFFGAIVVACIGWPRAPWWRRTISVLSVLATFAAVLTSLNKTYQYYPTVAALFGKNAVNQVGIPELDHLRSQVKSTGKLPDAGVTVTMPIPNKASGFAARDAYIWLPPAWFATPQPRLPAIILLEGTPGQPSDWTRAGFADQTANAFAKEHGGKAPIVVMPDPNGSFTGDTECVDSDMGKAETYLTKDVPGFVQGRLRAATGPRSLAIAGLSEGGTCSIMLALRHPEVFQTFADYSGLAHLSYQSDDKAQTVAALFGGSIAAYNAHDPLTLLSLRRYPGLAGWFEVGAADTEALAAQHKLQAAAHAAGIETCYMTRSGTHEFSLWAQAFRDSLPWISARLGATPPPTNNPAICVAGKP